MHTFKQTMRVLMIALAVNIAGTSTYADSYPNRPIRLIVPYPPGGGIDPSARVFAVGLSQQLDESIYIDNQGGASGRIGTRMAARAKPDGYTLLYGSVAPNVILPAAYGDDVGYNEERDFIPIALVAQADYVLLVSNSLSIDSVQDLVDYAKQHPQKLTYSSSGLLSGPHLAGELLGKLAGVQITHVPYRGNGPALSAVMSGEVSMTFDSAGGVATRGKSDRYKALAVTGGDPIAAFPDAPNLSKLYPGHDVSQWYGVFVTAGTPPDIVARLQDGVHKAVNSAEVKQKFFDMGLRTVLDSTSDTFHAYVASEIQRWQHIIKVNNIAVPPI
jgi:tripartite-type tricarboxylate transporter receptor subunit TctC